MRGISDLAVFRASIEKVVAMLSERGMKVTQQGLRAFVSYDKDGTPLAVNIPMLADDAAPEMIAAIRGFIDHEVGHLLFTDSKYVTSYMRRNKSDSAFKNLWNVMEDIFIEREMSKRFPGSTGNLHDTWTFVLNKQVKPAATKCGSDKELAQHLFPTIMHALAGKTAAKHFMDDNGYWPRVKELSDLLQGFVAQIHAMKSTQDAVALSNEIWKAIESTKAPSPPPPPPPPSSPPPPPPPPSDEKGEDGDEDLDGSEGEGSSDKSDTSDDGDDDEGDGEGDTSDDEGEDASDDASDDEGEDASDDGGDDEGDGEGDTSDDEGDGEGGDGDDEGEEGGGAGSDGDGSDKLTTETEANTIIEPGDEEEGDASEESAREGVIDPNLIGGDFADALAEGLSQIAVSQGRMRGSYFPFTKDNDIWVHPGDKMDQGRLAECATAIEKEMAGMVGQLSNQFKRIFAQQEFIVPVSNQRKGKIHAASLYKLRTGDDRVFFKREEHNSTDTAVTLLLDCSGSMSGSKISLAVTAAMAMSQTLERVGITHEVLGFTTTGHSDSATMTKLWEAENEARRQGVEYSRLAPIAMAVFKGFEERYRIGRARLASIHTDTVRRLSDKGMDLGANVDGESVQYAAARLLPRKEQRKILMVLSDGQPAGGNDAHLRAHLPKVVKELTAARVETVGIGIMTDSVRHYYPKYVVLQKADDLPSVVMKELSKLLIGKC